LGHPPGNSPIPKRTALVLQLQKLVSKNQNPGVELAMPAGFVLSVNVIIVFAGGLFWKQ